jgi:hypothetical protein
MLRSAKASGPASIVGLLLCGLSTGIGACTESEPPTGIEPTPIERIVVESPAGTPRPPFDFSEEDERLLDEIQHATFEFFWQAVSDETGMVRDRTSAEIISVAGVGFQLSALPIGVERGWITHEQGEQRALLILDRLAANEENRHDGLFFHFLEPESAGPIKEGNEIVVSTIDSALLLAGVITASSYFGEDVAEIGDALVEGANWAAFGGGDEAEKDWRGFVSLGWRPLDASDPTGPGDRLPFHWIDSGAEHRLVHFLAASAPLDDHRVGPEKYYGLRRRLGEHADSGVFAYFPWSGAHFTNIFDHCWIGYAGMGPDEPSAHGVTGRPRVDWWENGRRATIMHRRKAMENPRDLPTLGPNAWGLTACDCVGGYMVPGLFPEPVHMYGAVPGVDYPTQPGEDNWGDGTVAPYGAGASILFDRDASIAALRYYRELQDADGNPLLWRDPEAGGYGFADSFNLGTGWVASDHVAIDQGPLLLAIENARTGLIWRLFHAHPAVRSGMDRLGLRFDRDLFGL